MTDYIKLPPQDIEIEKIVLGALLLGSSLDNIPYITMDVFYSSNHACVFRAIKELHDEGQPHDIVTVVQRLRELKMLSPVYGPLEISQLTDRVISDAHIESHAQILYEKYMRRSVIQTGSHMIKNAYDESVDIFDLQAKSASELDNMVVFGGTSAPQGLKEMADEFESRNKKLLEQKGISGVASNLTELDNLTGGWQQTDLIILAARPGMGKTSMALKCAIEAAKANEPVIFYSLEMSRQQLYYRMAAMETGIPLQAFLRKGLNPVEQEIVRGWHENANKWPITIDDTGSLSVQDMRMKSRQIARKGHVGLIISDYLQLHTVKDYKGNNRNDEVSKISAAAKNIAKEINCPVIMLSQLSRGVESRGGDKRPMLSDLRDSGSIEQDADIVAFLYRPEYYGFTEDGDGNPTHGKAEIIVAKHRNGPIDTIVVGWDGQKTRFHNLGIGSDSTSSVKFQPSEDFLS